MVNLPNKIMDIGLSVIIITRNEEKDIESCLLSVSDLAQEIIVADSGSIDKTLSIVRRYTQKVFHKDWEGYGIQKQFALDQAKGPWVLNIDADERVSPGLKEEIKNVLSSPSQSVNGFEIPYRHYFLGRRLKFGGAGGERHIRLFRKSASSYGNMKIHEGVRVQPLIGRLKSPIDHLSYRDLTEYLTKCNEYTSLIAQQKFEKGDRFHVWHHLRLPFEFVVRYFLKLGILDGSSGLTYSLLSSYYVWMKYLKLRDLEFTKN